MQMVPPWTRRNGSLWPSIVTISPVASWTLSRWVLSMLSEAAMVPEMITTRSAQSALIAPMTVAAVGAVGRGAGTGGAAVAVALVAAPTGAAATLTTSNAVALR